MKIGLLGMSAKPYHAGHDSLLNIAVNENDVVLLFVSLSDRKRSNELPILGSTMQQIWLEFIEPSLSTKVTVSYGGVPVGKIYKELERAETINSPDIYSIYSDLEDIQNYSDKSLIKSAPTLFSNNQIIKRGINRSETIQVSGTTMRELLTNGDLKQFITFLPKTIQTHGKEIFKMLGGSVSNVNESLLKIYIKCILKETLL